VASLLIFQAIGRFSVACRRPDLLDNPQLFPRCQSRSDPRFTRAFADAPAVQPRDCAQGFSWPAKLAAALACLDLGRRSHDTPARPLYSGPPSPRHAGRPALGASAPGAQSQTKRCTPASSRAPTPATAWALELAVAARSGGRWGPYVGLVQITLGAAGPRRGGAGPAANPGRHGREPGLRIPCSDPRPELLACSGPLATT